MPITRRSYFPNPRLQLQMIVAANVLALISSALLATLLFLTEVHVESCISLLSLAPGESTLPESVIRQQQDLIRIWLLVAFVQFVLFNTTAVILSFRIAGPLHRLQSHLKAVAAGGDPTDVKFRKGDLYQEIADACNQLMARMRREAARP